MKGKRRLYTWLYLYGLGLLVVVGLAVIAVGAVSHRKPPWQEQARRLARFVAHRIADAHGDARRLERELRHLRELDIEATYYGMKGDALASNVEPLLGSFAIATARLESDERRGPRVFRHHGDWMIAVPVSERGARLGVLLARPVWAGEEWWLVRALAVVVVVLIVLAVASWPLARRLASPIAKLTDAARRLGEGDLRARTGLRGEDELGTLARSFDEMAERLEQSARAEKELLANVSHELRTPLARIRVAAELAAEGDAEKARRYLKEVGRDIGELDRLIDDVLTLTRLDLTRGRHVAAPTPLRLSPLEPEALVRDVAERFAMVHGGRNLEVSVAPGLPAVSADAVLVRRALENLLDNAVKYSPNGEPVELSVTSEPEALRFAVRDRGIGVKPEDAARLFQPFYRAEDGQRVASGLGLGLALVRKIAEAHGGSASARAADGGGSVFELRLAKVR